MLDRKISSLVLHGENGVNTRGVKVSKREYSSYSLTSKHKNDLNDYSLSKQTIYFDYSPVYNELKEILKNVDNKNITELQLEIEEILNITWIDMICSKKEHISNKDSVTSESFKFLHKHVTEYESYLSNIRKNIIKKINKSKKDDFIFSFKPLFDLTSIQISAIVFSSIIPILCLNEGISKNDLLMRIGKKLFHSWALEQYDKKYLISKKNKNFSDSIQISVHSLSFHRVQNVFVPSKMSLSLSWV